MFTVPQAHTCHQGRWSVRASVVGARWTAAFRVPTSQRHQIVVGHVRSVSSRWIDSMDYKPDVAREAPASGASRWSADV